MNVTLGLREARAHQLSQTNQLGASLKTESWST